MAKDTNRIYYGQLERFGYTLTAVGRSESEVRKALAREYVRAYKEANNGANPKEDYWDGGRSYYDVAMDEMYVDAFIPGKVEWL